MSKLPQISGRECVAALIKTGFYKKKQEGSHIIMRRDSPFSQTVVPDHKEIAKGTLRAILRKTGLSIDEFINLL
jgi:predicted RNA binding protein YcfA (HicA-like mRNA interferase family)